MLHRCLGLVKAAAGLLKDDLPIILANIITLGTSFGILYYKVLEVQAKVKNA